MTFTVGDTVRLSRCSVTECNGIEGTVRYSNDSDTSITVTKAGPMYDEGSTLTSRTHHFDAVNPEEIRYADVKQGDRIKVIHRNINTDTERVTTATVDSFGYGFAQDAECKQLAYGNLNNTGWNTQQIFLIERPTFDAVSKIVGAVVSIHGTGTGVKVMKDTWVLVYGVDTEYLTDEEFATRSDFSKYETLSEKPV